MKYVITFCFQGFWFFICFVCCLDITPWYWAPLGRSGLLVVGAKVRLGPGDKMTFWLPLQWSFRGWQTEQQHPQVCTVSVCWLWSELIFQTLFNPLPVRAFLVVIKLKKENGNWVSKEVKWFLICFFFGRFENISWLEYKLCLRINCPGNWKHKTHKTDLMWNYCCSLFQTQAF